MKLFVSEGNPQCVKAVAALEYTAVTCDLQLLGHVGKENVFRLLSLQVTLHTQKWFKLSVFCLRYGQSLCGKMCFE